MPRVPKFLKSILPCIGLAPGKSKNTPILVAKLDGHYIIEGGAQRLWLAGLLNLEYVTVRLVEYDYKSLIRRMRVHTYPNFNLVSVTANREGRCANYGAGPEQIEVLLNRYKVPFEDHVTGDKPAAAVGQRESRKQNTVKRRHNLILINK
jgi:hypothetical protein